MKPIGITMGCPVGIGPEIILRYFAQRQNDTPDCIVIGDLNILTQQARHFNIDIDCRPWTPGDEVSQNILPVFSISHLDMEQLQWGRPSQDTGKAMASYIAEAVALVQKDAISAITTCPITKSALNAAGFHYPGHTEMLAELCDESHFSMMMAGSKLRVTLVTIHCSISNIIASLSQESIINLIRLTHNSLQNDFGIRKPHIAVAGLNPHAGESGMFGTEEIDIIAPAVAAAKSENIQAVGPFPPDTVFVHAAAGNFDAVVCMYHDQGLIPFKLLHFSDGVNMTIGLPLVRTSVDHGTAYDIAGQGCAEFTSLTAAVDMARLVAENRSKM